MAEHKRRARWRLLGAVLFSTATAAVVLMLFEDTPRSLQQDFILKWPAPSATASSAPEQSPPEPATNKTPEAAAPASAVAEPAATSAPAAPATPAASAPTPAAPKSANAKTKPYFLQLGAYSQKSSAEAARKKLEAPGRRLVVVSLSGQSGPRHRLRMGPFASEREADAARARLKLEGVEATLI
ncbi:MAG TPA: SPOR domain-containing protein, partial [Burkholderiaceae bacterium]|nr:SPOR domain-containing protein [Burkholderiaceae bacterium]